MRIRKIASIAISGELRPANNRDTARCGYRTKTAAKENIISREIESSDFSSSPFIHTDKSFGYTRARDFIAPQKLLTRLTVVIKVDGEVYRERGGEGVQDITPGRTKSITLDLTCARGPEARRRTSKRSPREASSLALRG